MPSLDEITACLDDGATPLLQKHKTYIERALEGENVDIPYDQSLCLSAFLVELGVIVAYLTERPIFMLTHAVYWTHQAIIMRNHAMCRLNDTFGKRHMNMEIKVPVLYSDITRLDEDDYLVLTHGVNMPANKQCIHQELGSAWDGMIRTSLQHD